MVIFREYSKFCKRVNYLYYAGSLHNTLIRCIEEEKSVHATADPRKWVANFANATIVYVRQLVYVEMHIIIMYRPKYSSLSVDTCSCKTYIHRHGDNNILRTVSRDRVCGHTARYRITGITTIGHNNNISTTCTNCKYKDSADRKRNRAETVVRAARYTSRGLIS
jgi:hypothetical protein